tara:strand:- start:5298 stop:6794 length:1497 start_codon:yes stop_codon:yes gene_type:complete
MLNNLIAIKIKNRIKLIERAIKNPIEYQNKILIKNIEYSKTTLFGDKHNFNKIKNYNDFKDQVPLSDYEKLKQYIELAIKHKHDILWPGKIKWFAKSSGTTNNKSKFIPITNESLKSCHFKAGKDMLSLYLQNNPNSKILKGKSLMIGGSTNINKIKYSYSGDLSAIIIKNLPIWVQLKRLPSIKTALLEDWEKKITNIIEESFNQNITNISGVPSWMAVIINQLMDKMDVKCLTDIWPNLELYMHGGISFQNYRKSFENYINKREINYMELYNASEGFFGIQNQKEKSDLLLLIDHGIFYEFIPIENGQEKEEDIVSLENVQINKIYAMVITTNGGLWRYKIGDTIRFTSIKPYKIKISGRTQSFINAFGEELNEDVANLAIEYASNKTNSIVSEYTAGPLLFSNKTGAHEWLIEFQKKPNNLEKFIHLLDKKLKILNSDYDAKRSNDILLKTPIVKIVEKNFFYISLKRKNKIGGQNKIQRLHNNRIFLDELIKKL